MRWNRDLNLAKILLKFSTFSFFYNYCKLFSSIKNKVEEDSKNFKNWSFADEIEITTPKDYLCNSNFILQINLKIQKHFKNFYLHFQKQEAKLCRTDLFCFQKWYCFHFIKNMSNYSRFTKKLIMILQGLTFCYPSLFIPYKLKLILFF